MADEGLQANQQTWTQWQEDVREADKKEEEARRQVEAAEAIQVILFFIRRFFL